MSATQGPEGTPALMNCMEPIHIRAKEVRKAIEEFLLKIEHEHTTLSWPTVLDNFALLSGHISSLLSMMKSDKTLPLRNYPVVPLRLNPDTDPVLMELTGRRVPIMSHAEVPDYLRTKPDPEVEQTERQLLAEVMPHTEQTSVSPAQLTQFNKQCNRVLDKIKVARSNWQADQVNSRSSATAITFKQRATEELVAAVYYGRGIKLTTPVATLQSADQKTIIIPNTVSMHNA